MLYAVKDLACTRRKKPFRRQGIDSAFEDCYKMAGAAGASRARWGLIDQTFCKSWEGIGV
jgi:hypothetical protein